MGACSPANAVNAATEEKEGPPNKAVAADCGTAAVGRANPAACLQYGQGLLLANLLKVHLLLAILWHPNGRVAYRQASSAWL
jgi:hypothetical protein